MLHPTPDREGSVVRRIVGSAALILASVSAVATGQQASGQQTSHACFAPRPRPRCDSWFITEAGLFRRFTDVQDGDESTLFAYSLGWMVNRGARSAVGGELFGGAEGEVRGGLAVRGRRWLSERSALDVSAGIHLYGDASSQNVAAGSPMVKVRLTHADLIAVTARVDVLKLQCGSGCYPTPGGGADPNATTTRFYLGAEAGAGVGVLGMVVTGLVVLGAILVYAAGS
jgi:hypothetical protein